MPRPRILIVMHQDNCGPALWDGPLAAAAEPITLRPYAGDPVPASADGYDGVLVLGGAMGVGDTATVAWLAPVMALLRRAVADGVSVLGVCLGAQLLAAACGGTVRRAPQGPEIGVFPLDTLPAAADDPLLAAADGAPALMWHYDEVSEPPPGAVVLARTDHCAIQAYRIGGHAWGLQFHPEAGAASAAAWGDEEGTELRRLGRDRAALIAAVRVAEPALRRAWIPIVDRWLAVMGERRAAA
jgi:GMP synthase-like glutamine amidotransferase